MGEPTPPIPPSGDCPGCLAEMPDVMYGRVTLPLAEKVFEGKLSQLWCGSLWLYLWAYFCVEPGHGVSLIAYGGYLGSLVLTCGCEGLGCWPIRTCNHYNPEGEITGILETWAAF